MEILHHLIQKFIDQRILTFDGQEWRTSNLLLSMGLACCPDRGHIFSTYPVADYCPQCEKRVLIIPEDAPVKRFIPTILEPATKSRFVTMLSDVLGKDVCKSCGHPLAQTVKYYCKQSHWNYRYKNGLTRKRKPR